MGKFTDMLRERLSKPEEERVKALKERAGCLPMLIQIPFFIAFYWVLLESVEVFLIKGCREFHLLLKEFQVDNPLADEKGESEVYAD